MSDPLSDFLQNGSKPAQQQQMLPVQYQVQPNLFDSLNPMSWIKSQMQSNPQMKEVMSVVEQNGGDPKAAFYKECEKRGLNPDRALQSIRQNPLFQRFFK